jgi:homoserine O-succinyltransferase
MPINIPFDLPAYSALENENIFVMSDAQAIHQDIRPLRIALVNLMPTKIATELQLLRLIGNSPLQVDVTLLRTREHIPRNTPPEHLERFYRTFDDVCSEKFDGMVITGAPVEKIAFEEVDYWRELQEIMDYSARNVFSTLYICWGAQAGLYHRFGVPKHMMESKLSGIYPHRLRVANHKLFRGFDDVFYVPHSRYTEVRRADVEKCPQLEVLCDSDEAGVAVVMARETGEIFITGHLEYEADTLAKEYCRDLAQGLEPDVPKNYFPLDDPSRPPVVSWRAHAHLFFSNWLNYHVYQETPFDLDAIRGSGRTAQQPQV